jgi:hypothetical protein
MAITLPNTTIPISYPLDTEQFVELLVQNLFDGVTAGAVSAGKVLIADANGNITGLGKPATIVAAGSTKTLTAANNNNAILLNTATGSVVTLPPATGSGDAFNFYVSVLATSNSHIIYTSSANAVGGTANNFIGLINGSRVDSTNVVLGFAAAATSNTITLNRTTTGSVSLGEWLEVTDIAANVWEVKGMLSATGASFATPFSHT